MLQKITDFYFGSRLKPTATLTKLILTWVVAGITTGVALGIIEVSTSLLDTTRNTILALIIAPLVCGCPFAIISLLAYRQGKREQKYQFPQKEKL